MWRCRHCGESVEDNFDICWKCGRAAVESDDETPEHLPEPTPVPRCKACDATIEDRGVAMIHVRPEVVTLWDVLADQAPGEWRVRVQVCTGCRRVELYESDEE